MNRSHSEVSTLTRSYIKTAMLELLAQTSYEKISITDLVARAGVSRTAFYRNFSSKDELIDELFADIMKSIASRNAKALKEYSYDDFLHFYRDVRARKREIMLINKAGVENLNILHHKVKMSEEILANNKNSSYIDSAIVGAFSSILSKWFLSGLIESDEEIALISYTTIQKLTS